MAVGSILSAASVTGHCHVVCCGAFRQSILDVSGQVPPEVIQQLVTACKSGVYAQVQQQVRVHVDNNQQHSLCCMQVLARLGCAAHCAGAASPFTSQRIRTALSTVDNHAVASVALQQAQVISAQMCIAVNDTQTL